MKFLTRALFAVLAVAMLAACGGGSSSSKSTTSGAGATGPIVGAAVTLERTDGTVIATGTTGANGAYTLETVPASSDYPVVLTVASTAGSTYPNGDAFVGELKGLFTGGSTDSFHVTTFSTLLYQVWVEQERPTDPAELENVKALTVALLQRMGIDVDGNDIFTTNPVDPAFEAKQQLLMFAAGLSDASGAADSMSKLLSIAEEADAASNNSLASTIQANTGLTVNAATIITVLHGATVQQQIAERVVDALAGSSAATTLAAVNPLVGAQATAAAARGNNPGLLAFSYATGANVVANGTGSSAGIALTVTGAQVDGGAPSAGAFTFTLPAGVTADVSGAFNSATTINFTVTDISVAATYTIPVVYTEGTVPLTRSFVITVLGADALKITDVTSNVSSLAFNGTGANITAGDVATLSSVYADVTKKGADKNVVVSVVLPSDMRFKNADTFSVNYDTTVALSGTSATRVTLPSAYSVVANASRLNGSVTWTMNVYDATRSTLLQSESVLATAYSQASADKIRSISSLKYDHDRSAGTFTPASEVNYGASGIPLSSGGFVVAGEFTGNVQTWAISAGDSTTCPSTPTVGTIFVQETAGVERGFNATNVDSVNATVAWGSISSSVCPVTVTTTISETYNPNNLDVMYVNIDGVNSGSGVSFVRQ